MSPRRQRLITLVLMGVAGVGKSSVMAELAARLGWPTLEGDSLHPLANVAKMTAGNPLSDAERLPWLRAVAAWIGEQEAHRTSSIVTCSALRRSYRDLLRRGHPSVWFIHLVAPIDVLETRIERRRGHYMPASMLASQVATLEPLERGEPGSTIDAIPAPDGVAEQVIEALRLEPALVSRGVEAARP
jgi:gluconokinase